MCRKLGSYQHLPLNAPQYDISSVGEDRPDEVPIEVAPSDNSNDGEATTLQKQMASEVGTEESLLTPVQKNQL